MATKVASGIGTTKKGKHFSWEINRETPTKHQRTPVYNVTVFVDGGGTTKRYDLTDVEASREPIWAIKAVDDTDDVCDGWSPW